ncbi:hypothetical protein WN944_019671 [Citrus x changshan-huyou]|uniref:Uncharacterized protein n=1 Tax=Citrus x changshan-huyou TaxID=2935761 RepID=A0AAP0QFC8_9ROSI
MLFATSTKTIDGILFCTDNKSTDFCINLLFLLFFLKMYNTRTLVRLEAMT